MKKPITYVLMVSNVFPRGIGMDGVNTYFPVQIREGTKIHTIRANYALWKKRIDAVVAGKATLSVREWSGKPYRSSQVEIIRLDHLSGIGIEKVKLLLGTIPFVNDSILPSTSDVAHNDGLSVDEFRAWFRDYEFNKEMAIIHFTPFRYS